MDYKKPTWGKGFYPALILLLFFSGFGIAQTKVQMQQIAKASKQSQLKELIAQFQRDYQQKNKKLQNIVASRNLQAIQKKLDGTVVAVNDIGVDGTLLYYTTHMDPTSKVSRADALYTDGILDLGLSGNGMQVGVWDAGAALTTHREYDSRVENADAAEVDHHGTLVTGTIVSSGIKKEAKGVAFEAKALSHDWSRDKIEVTEAALNGLLVSNHSYGIATDAVPDWYFGAYIRVSQDWDNIMYNAPYYLMVTAAGNAQNSFDNQEPIYGKTQDGFDLLLGFTTSKNGLVIAGADADIDSKGNLKDAHVSGYSSFGPIDDGRIKPDLAGDGTLINSTSANSDTSYSSSMGTSMAAPGVTGSLLLLQEYHQQLYGNFMRAATLKGIALHTADDVKEAGPDYKMGWGVINSKKAAETLRNKDFSSIITEESLTEGESYSIVVKSNGETPFSASISWTDPAGLSVNSRELNAQTTALTNDLDILVTKDGEVFRPWKLNPMQASARATKGDNSVDPFERVDINAAAGQYTITITHKGQLLEGSQDFSLIITGAELTSCTLDIPEGLDIDMADTNAVTLSWPTKGAETLYEYRYRNENEADWQTGATWGNTLEMEELKLGNQYTVQIRSVCSQNLASEYSEEFQFIFNGEETQAMENKPLTLGEELTVSVFPNPVANQLFIEANLSPDAQYAIVSLAGNVVKSGNANHDIGVTDLSDGMYILTVQDYNGVKSIKFYKNQ